MAAGGERSLETARSSVPRYHFDLVDSKTVADEGGAELPDDIKALDVEEIGRLPLDILH